MNITKNGGHVGFISGSFYNPSYWLEDKIVDFLASKK
jgi:predicted alpha/beta-fold hydrolase